MSYEISAKLEKQHEIMELLQSDLHSNQSIVDNRYVTTLERDLDNAIIQIQRSFLEGRI